uniref:Uncharacterized protein n=1 Tax=Aegilops tauschii subsp. strangulata TaxID=200361 RepID=A0A453EZ18_AEGTS
NTGAMERTGSSADGTGPSTSSSYSTADADDNGTAGGAKVWLLVLLFSLLLLLFLPSAVRRGGGGFQRGGITLKSGWDVVNLCLVLFAILCGLLGRGGGDGDGEPPGPAAPAPKSHLRVSPAAAATPEPSTEDVWASFNNSYTNHNAQTGIRRMKSSSSYPELRLDSDGVWGLASPELAWRSYDDAELYRTRRDERPDRARDADRSLRRTSSDVKTIPVDTYEVRTRPLPQDARRRRRSVERLPKMDEVEEERTHPAETETLATPARSRTWSPEELDATLLGVEEKRTRPTETRATPARSRTWSPEELGAIRYWRWRPQNHHLPRRSSLAVAAAASRTCRQWKKWRRRLQWKRSITRSRHRQPCFPQGLRRHHLLRHRRQCRGARRRGAAAWAAQRNWPPPLLSSTRRSARALS